MAIPRFIKKGQIFLSTNLHFDETRIDEDGSVFLSPLFYFSYFNLLATIKFYDPESYLLQEIETDVRYHSFLVRADLIQRQGQLQPYTSPTVDFSKPIMEEYYEETEVVPTFLLLEVLRYFKTSYAYTSFYLTGITKMSRYDSIGAPRELLKFFKHLSFSTYQEHCGPPKDLPFGIPIEHRESQQKVFNLRYHFKHYSLYDFVGEIGLSDFSLRPETITESTLTRGRVFPDIENKLKSYKQFFDELETSDSNHLLEKFMVNEARKTFNDFLARESFFTNGFCDYSLHRKPLMRLMQSNYGQFLSAAVTKKSFSAFSHDGNENHILYFGTVFGNFFGQFKEHNEGAEERFSMTSFIPEMELKPLPEEEKTPSHTEQISLF